MGTDTQGKGIPQHADVVIVGAGVAGISLAYHLALRGVTDVVVVDQGPLWETGGSTSHAPGLIFQLASTRTMTRLAMETVELLSHIDCDGAPCFHAVGGLEVAASPERHDELHRRHGRAMSFGHTSAILTPEETLRLVPLLDASRILSALHTPTDGIVDAIPAVTALAGDAIQSGVRAFGTCTVLGFGIEGGHVRSVETSHGTIGSDVVALCAGVWGPKVAALAGVELPLVPVEHQYAITAPLPQLSGYARKKTHEGQPLLRHQDYEMYFRQDGERYGVGSYRHQPLIVEPEEILASGDRHPTVLPFTPGDFEEALGEAGRLIPPLSGVGIERSFNGLMSFTPDGFPLLGETAKVKGLWLGEAIWVTHAGGCGRVLADLIVDGGTDIDLHELEPQRFDGHGTSRSYWRERGAQQYREVYDVVHPRRQSGQARPMRRTPLFHRQAELGAVFFESAGWERPQWYAANTGLAPDVQPRMSDWAGREWSPIAIGEHLATRQYAGLFDLSPFTKIKVSGPGATSYLQRLAANDVDRPVGAIVYTPMLSQAGGIMCDLTITRTGEDSFLVVTGAAIGRHDIAWMTRNLPETGVALENCTSALACLGVWGPRARAVLSPLADIDLANDAFPYMTARQLHVGYAPVRALRMSYVGELGWELYTPTEFALTLWDSLWEAGEEHGLIAAGGAAYDSMRLEKGYRLWGQDIDEEHGPHEAGLGWTVRLDKGEFIGRDAALRAKDHIRRRLCCLTADDPSVLFLGAEPIISDGRAIGYVTSGGYGASVESSILYAYLPVEKSAAGTCLTAYSEGELHPLTVASEPLFDPKMARLRDVSDEPEVEVGELHVGQEVGRSEGDRNVGSHYRARSER